MLRTVGEILKGKRIEKNLSLSQVETATKIRVRYLEAIERNDFAKISGGAPIAKGFIRNYAEFLGILASEILAVFRRDFRESKTGQIIPQGYLDPLNSSGFKWNPRLTLLTGVVALILVLSSYIFFQVRSYLAAPRLMVDYPAEKALISQSEIQVTGKSDPDSTVWVNSELASVDQEGRFSLKVSLFPGENSLKIESVSRRGQKTEITRHVERESW